MFLDAYGLEGVTFNYVNGKPRHIDANLKDPAGRVPGLAAPQDYGINMPNNAKNEIIIPEFNLEAKINGYAKIAKVKNIYLAPLPTLPYTVPEQQRAAAILATLEPRQEEYMVKFITGQMSFDDWAKFVTAMKQMGSDELTKIINDAYARWKKL